MKKITFIAMLGLFSSIYADEIDDLVKKIAQDRTSSINSDELINIKSPIARLVQKENTSKSKSKSDGNNTIIMTAEDSFNLTAIMNDSAYINKKWVKKGQKIGSYELYEIYDDMVVLKDGNRTKKVTFQSKNNKIKITGR